MVIGSVIGEITMEKMIPNGENIHWVYVRTQDRILIAADLLQVKAGDCVLVCTGSRAGMMVTDCAVDAVIVGIVTENANNS